MASNLSIAMATGMDNVAEDMGMGRPQGTTRPDIGPGSTGQGAYGIGGPPVTIEPDENDEVADSLRREAPQLRQQQLQQNVSDGSQLPKESQREGNSGATEGNDATKGGGGVETVESEPGTVASRTKLGEDGSTEGVGSTSAAASGVNPGTGSSPSEGSDDGKESASPGNGA
jgi:hypothetical protein